jgi:hypothetical protein
MAVSIDRAEIKADHLERSLERAVLRETRRLAEDQVAGGRRRDPLCRCRDVVGPEIQAARKRRIQAAQNTLTAPIG